MKEMRRKDRQIIDVTEIKEILNKAQILHLGLMGEVYPYVVPLHYGYEWIDDTIHFYLHCAKVGKKLDLIRNNPHAFVQIDTDMEVVHSDDTACSYGSLFKSFMANGDVEIVEDPTKKVHAVKVLMHTQTGKDFEMNEQMVQAIAVLHFTVKEYSAKARNK